MSVCILEINTIKIQVSFWKATVQYFSDLSALHLWTKEGLSLPHGVVCENKDSSLLRLINFRIVLIDVLNSQNTTNT
jgi:hypothetical protein